MRGTVIEPTDRKQRVRPPRAGIARRYAAGGAVATLVAVWRLRRAHRWDIDEAFGMVDRAAGVGPE